MANRYWVGGTGTWNTTNTANWSTTSGGASGASVPGVTDVVFFDGNTGDGTITLDYSPTVQRILIRGTNTKTVDFGANTITLNTANNTAYGFLIDSGTTNLTITAGSSTINSTGWFRSEAGTFTYGNIILNTLSTPSSTAYISGTFTCANLTILGASTATAPYRDICFTYYQGTPAVITVTEDFTATGSAQRPLTLFGIRGSSTINVTGTVELTDVNLHHMTCGGTWAGTRVGDAGGNTGTITYDTPRDLYWIGNGGNWQDNSKWSTTSGGASATTYPLPQDICHFDANSFSTTGQTVTLNSFWLPAMDCTGVTNNPSLGTGSVPYPVFVGSEYTFNSGLQFSLAFYPLFSTPVTGTMTFTSNGFNWDATNSYIEINNGEYNEDIGGTFVFADDFNAPDTYLYSGGGDYVIQINNGADVTLDVWDLDGTGSTDVTHTINGTLSVANNFYNYSFTKLTYTGTGAIYLTAGGNNRIFQLGATDDTSFCGVPVYINRNNVVRIGVDVELSELIATNQFSPNLNFLDNAEINTLTVDTATLQSSISGTPRTLTIGTADIKRATISDITVAQQVIKAKNSTDAGGNTNINFIDVPTNLNTTQSSIINSTTATSNVTNL